MGNYRVEELTFTRADGKHIVGKLYLPAKTESDAAGKYRTAIFSHGFGSNYRELEHYGPRFSEQGLALYVYDFCGGGRNSLSDGKTTEMSVLTEMEDLCTVIDGIKKHPEVDADRLYLMGESQGGYVTALTGARYPDSSAGLILWYPAFCIAEDWKDRFPGGLPEGDVDVWEMKLGRVYYEDIFSVDIYEEIAGYPKNVLIIHGDCDPTVNISYGRKAHEVYAHSEMIEIPGAGHGFDGADSLRAGQASIDFIKR